MPITLLCLVKGNTTASAFPIHIDGNSLVSDLKEVIKEKNAQTFANVDAEMHDILLLYFHHLLIGLFFYAFL